LFFARSQRLYQITAAVLFALIAGAVMAAILARDAQGATLTVTNITNSASGSLRAQIAAAAPGDTIDFAPGLSGQTITLTSGELYVDKNLTISGPAAGVTVSGNNFSRVFNIGVFAVNISNLTVLGGYPSGYGGGIYNAGTVTLTNSTVSGNSSVYGGGIFNEGVFNLTNSTVSGNTVTSPTNGGGGIYNYIGATLTLTNSTVSGNTAPNGGGILNEGTFNLNNSTVGYGNTATSSGGGIWNLATLNLTNSTVSGNSAPDVGGGILNSGGGTATLTNSTVSGNSAPDGGGGIYNYSFSTLTLTNSTVSGNSSGGNGGGIYNSLSTLTLTNSIVGNQVSGADCAGNSLITSGGYNLASDGTCNLTATGDLPGANPMLAPLALNAPGATKTHALQVGSPAINRIPAGVNGCGTTVATDQRGVARPQGAHCDIGAYETTDLPTPTTLTVTNLTDSDPGSLRAQIAAAAPGDTIDFAAGLSLQTITLTGEPLHIDKNLTISGPVGGITVSGNNSRRVFGVNGVTVNISNLVVSSGNTSGYGAGIWNYNGATLNLTNSTVSGNTAASYGGGGIYNYGATLNLANSTVSGNTAGSGGGIYNDGGAVITLTNSTVSENAADDGGGIYNDGGAVITLTNSTVSGNAADDGGGIDNEGTFNLNNSTVSGNSSGFAGGISNSGTVNLANSIVANQGSGGDCYGSPFTSAGYNLASDGSCNLTATGDLPNTNPMLDPLALNSGVTQTHALQPGSPAINHIPAGVNGCGTTVATDQRGVARPQGAGCDIGAYELIYVITPTPSPTPSPTPTPTPTPTPPAGFVLWGDINCLNGIKPDDALALVVNIAGAQQSSALGAGCPDIGAAVGARTWGNVDCLAGVGLPDAIAILKHFLGLAYDRAAGCPIIGDSIQVS
jgi:hypothetical protein